MKYLKTKLAVAASVMGASVANADLPEGVTGAFTTIQTDGLALIDLAWPVLIAVTGGFIIMGLFKKAAKRAAS